jgi:hypothetical protein
MTELDTNRFNVNMDADEFLAVMRALHFYADRITNIERGRGRDDAEWDTVMFLQHKLSNQLKKDVFIP